MGRVLNVEILRASSISQKLRHVKGLKVKPYIKAKCTATGSEKETSVAEEEEKEEGSAVAYLWKEPFQVALQEELAVGEGEMVEFQLFLQRSLKPHKLVARLGVAVADFGSGGSRSKTYEMEYVKEKFLLKNGRRKITMDVTAGIARADIPAADPSKASKLKHLKIVGEIVKIGGELVSVALAVADAAGATECD